MLKTFLPVLLLVFASQLYGQNTNSPCACCSEEYKQFDFWIGEWTVTNNGQFAGTNSIVFVENDCALKENWIASNGTYTGTSYNYYDRRTKTWNQTWIDNQGGSLSISGKFQNGSMILMDEPGLDGQGNHAMNRITWTPKEDGSVRQLWELSNDFGKTWSSLFDGIYVKKKDSQE